MLTIICVLVKANVPYTMEYVERLQSMVLRHLGRPHKFVVLTDDPFSVPAGVHTAIKIPTPPKGQGGWWSKLQIFNPALGLSGKAIYLDLDVLLTQNLDAIVDFPQPMALIPHAGTFNGRKGLRVVKRYNSSVIKFNLGEHPELFEQFNIGVTRRLWGDQDWIAERLPDLPTMPLDWFPRLSELLTGDASSEPPDFGEAKVVLCKRPKNADAAAKWPWFNEMWR